MKEKIIQLKEYQDLEQKKRPIFRLVLLLFIFFILIIAIIYYNTSYSKVDKIIIKGNEITQEEQILVWSKIDKEDFFLFIDTKKITKNLEKQAEIKEAQVRKRFLNTIEIVIHEHGIFGYFQDGENKYPFLTSGKVIRNYPVEIETDLPIFINFAEGKYLSALVGELQTIPAPIMKLVSEVHYSPLERDPEYIYIYMSDGMKILGTRQTIATNLQLYPNLIANIEQGVKGTFDMEVGVSFIPYFVADDVVDDNSEVINDDNGYDE